MYSRYVPNKLLIAHKSRLLFTYNGSLRTFLESVAFRRNDRGVLIGRTLSLNCCTQQAEVNSLWSRMLNLPVK